LRYDDGIEYVEIDLIPFGSTPDNAAGAGAPRG
jgi:hypothetical protein